MLNAGKYIIDQIEKKTVLLLNLFESVFLRKYTYTLVEQIETLAIIIFTVVSTYE